MAIGVTAGVLVSSPVGLLAYGGATGVSFLVDYIVDRRNGRRLTLSKEFDAEVKPKLTAQYDALEARCHAEYNHLAIPRPGLQLIAGRHE